MTEYNWKILENMIDKIMADCMGEELYNGLKSYLNGKTLTIQFKEGSNGSFGMARRIRWNRFGHADGEQPASARNVSCVSGLSKYTCSV